MSALKATGQKRARKGVTFAWVGDPRETPRTNTLKDPFFQRVEPELVKPARHGIGNADANPGQEFGDTRSPIRRSPDSSTKFIEICVAELGREVLDASNDLRRLDVGLNAAGVDEA